MAPPRPYWKGYLKLSLVSCPVALYASTSSSERVSFKQINKATGNRLRQQLVDDQTREPVDSADKGRGYEVSKNTYLLIEDEEIEAVSVESNHTIDIDSFVARAQIDERYLDSPYYLIPDDKVGQEAFAVIREAMRGKDMVALGRIVLARRERVMMLQAWDKGLLGTTLRYPYEVRDAESYFSDIADIKISREMLGLAEHILESKAADFDPSQFRDRFEEALIEMLKKKQAGVPMPKSGVVPSTANAVSLIEALKRSLANENNPPSAKGKKPRKRVEGQREMLLPIAGKGPAKEGTKKPAAVTRQRKAG
ncbi:MAG: Ku protein [Beijerinckiaceae bacterium]